MIKLTMQNKGCGNCNSTFEAMHWIKRKKKGEKKLKKWSKEGGKKGRRRELFIKC